MNCYRRIFLAALIGASVSIGGMAVAKDIDVVGSNITTTVRSDRDDDIEVIGSDNTVYVETNCDDIEVKGSGNTIYAQGVREIEFEGANNTVYHKSRFEPRVTYKGANNKVVRY